MSSAPGTAWAYYPSNDAKGVGGDVWLNKTSYNSPVLGTYAWMTFTHEIGHALGLKHGHEADGGFPALPASHDSVEYSVMTYRGYVGDPLAGGGYALERTSYPQTLMMNDIAALQFMYGANFTTNAGNTVYGWSPTTGEGSSTASARAGRAVTTSSQPSGMAAAPTPTISRITPPVSSSTCARAAGRPPHRRSFHTSTTTPGTPMWRSATSPTRCSTRAIRVR
jgi:hypothetical protein